MRRARTSRAWSDPGPASSGAGSPTARRVTPKHDRPDPSYWPCPGRLRVRSGAGSGPDKPRAGIRLDSSPHTLGICGHLHCSGVIRARSPGGQRVPPRTKTRCRGSGCRARSCCGSSPGGWSVRCSCRPHAGRACRRTQRGGASHRSPPTSRTRAGRRTLRGVLDPVPHRPAHPVQPISPMRWRACKHWGFRANGRSLAASTRLDVGAAARSRACWPERHVEDSRTP